MATLVHPSGLVLSCEARLEGDALLLSYALDNGTGASVAALNRFVVPSPGGAARVAPEAAYTDLAGDVLTVSMRVLEVPPGLRVAERELPFVTPVARGGRFAEAVRFARPVRLRSPYREALLRAAAPPMHTVAPSLPAHAARVRFELAVATVSPPVTLREDSPGVFRLWPPGPALASAALLVLDLQLPEPVDVLDLGPVPLDERADGAR